MSTRISSLLLAGALLAPAAAVLAQGAPPPPRPVPPPPVLQGGRLPLGQPKPPPPIETIDDPSCALVIDGEKIPREAYGAALVQEFGDSFAEQYAQLWLMERRAKQLKVEVPQAEVDAAAEKQKKEILEKRFRNDETAFRGSLAQSGLTLEGWLSGLKRRLARDLLARAVVKADRDVSEAGLKKEFETRYGPGGVKRVGRHVFLSTQVWTSNAYTQEDYEKEKPQIEADARKRAEAVKAELASGKPFAEVAAARSEDAMAQKGGSYGRYWRNRFGAEADAKIAALKPGETSDIIATPRGFIIAQATGMIEGWEFKARHILLSTTVQGDVPQALRDKKVAEAKAEAEQIIADVKAGKRKFEEVAAERSDDSRSKTRGGDLGTFETGTMVPEFEAACMKLKDGEISEPIQTQYGIHVIQLEEKKRRPDRDNMNVSVILCSTEFLKVKERKLKDTLEESAKKRADECAAKLKTPGVDGAAVAREFSDDIATKEQGGEVSEPLGPMLEKEIGAAFAGLQEPGAVTIVKGERGYHVLKLERIEKHDFAEVKDALVKELKEKEPTPAEVREYREKLRAAVKVQKSKFN
ncbi:MAG TPA: peptidylprolyl isomerase [Planctomycetota bacterium]|nr:peptidylprolyl isomerase [Planctomycetota bacterium]